MRLLKINPDQPEPDKIKLAAKLIQAGELVAFPTDTVYGLAAEAKNEKAVDLLFQAKQRPEHKPIVLLIADKEEANRLWSEVTDRAKSLIELFWPGPLTLIMNANACVPEFLLANNKSIALRMPDNPVALEIIRAVGSPLATSSANLSGQPEPLIAEQVRESLGSKIALLLDGGRCSIAQPSTILDLTGAEAVIRREGAIKAAKLRLGVVDLV